MKDTTIGLIAAMPDEIRPLLRLAGRHEKERIAGFATYRFDLGGRHVFLVESGMGTERAAMAAGLLIDRASPAIVVNFGFGGAVTAGPAVGDIVVATRILLQRGRLFSEQPGLAPELAEKTATLLDGNHVLDGQVHRGTFVTAAEIVSKGAVAGLLPAGVATPVLEMETAAVARVAARERVPLVALRGVSDGAEEELGFTIDEFADREMRIRPGKVLLTVARKPWIIPQLVRLARNSRLAGRTLAKGVMAVVTHL